MYSAATARSSGNVRFFSDRASDLPNHTLSNAERAANVAARSALDQSASRPQEAAARGDLLRELRWKNKAWLATADTIAG